MIGGFIEGYLRLAAAEMKKYEREFAALAPEERKNTTVMITSWEQKGIDKGLQQGRREGMEHIVLRQLRRQVGSLSQSYEQRIDELSTDQLDVLSEALPDKAVLVTSCRQMYARTALLACVLRYEPVVFAMAGYARAQDAPAAAHAAFVSAPVSHANRYQWL